MFNAPASHIALCNIGAKWLKKSCPQKCPVSLIEMVSYCPEQPDVIGFNGSYSVLLEAKTSRADFKKDAKKHWRLHPETGVGDFRLFICPENLIQIEEVPEHWGLVWVDTKGKCTLIKDVFQRGGEWKFIHIHQKNQRYERSLMYSALRRIYSNQKLKGFNC